MLSTADLFSAFRWWAVLAVLGLAATPLTFRLLRWLPDRGYAFTKMIGLLIVGYIFWLFGSLGFLNNSVGGTLFGVAALVSLSALAWVGLRSNSPADPDDRPGSEPFSEMLGDSWAPISSVGQFTASSR